MTSFNRNCLEENNNNRLTLMKIDCYLQISVIVEAKSCHYSHFPCGYPNMASFTKNKASQFHVAVCVTQNAENSFLLQRQWGCSVELCWELLFLVFRKHDSVVLSVFLSSSYHFSHVGLLRLRWRFLKDCNLRWFYIFREIWHKIIFIKIFKISLKNN